jgi:competence protein ComFB
MFIHNIMEDMVQELVEEIFNDIELEKRETFCSCYQCKNDVMCYVLNRINPIYIFTSRGASRFKMDYLDNLQRKADIATLIHKGIRRVVKSKRPHFLHMDEADKSMPSGIYFNFPTITGKIINSITFEPLGNVSVMLLHNGQPVEMINPNWQNPYTTHTSSAGIFTFLPKPHPAREDSQSQVFEFELAVDDSAYDAYRRYFEITVIARPEYIEYYTYNTYHDMEDIYLIPKTDEE